jgi:hypothetical protein
MSKKAPPKDNGIQQDPVLAARIYSHANPPSQQMEFSFLPSMTDPSFDVPLEVQLSRFSASQNTLRQLGVDIRQPQTGVYDYDESLPPEFNEQVYHQEDFHLSDVPDVLQQGAEARKHLEIEEYKRKVRAAYEFEQKRRAQAAPPPNNTPT